MVGITSTQLVCTGLMFRPRGSWLEFLGRYLGTPPAGLPGWLLAGVVVVLYVAYSASTSPVVRQYALHPGSWRPFIGIRLVAIFMAFVTGFFEEAFFRKFVMDAAAAQGYGVAAQIVGSALIFGALHAVWGVFGGKLRAAAAIMAVTSLLGALLAVVYVAAGRSIAPAIAAHVAINLILEPWLIMTSATGSWRQKALPA